MFRQTGRAALADEIMAAMSGAGYDVRERNPFEAVQVFAAPRQATTPIVGRIEMLWESMRGSVIENSPKAPGLPKDKRAYLHFIDEIYKSDTYHSLSIEGYSVTPALIERARRGNWDPGPHEDDRESRDALAARGYWQAFQVVKQSVEKVMGGENAGARGAPRTRSGIAACSSPASWTTILKATPATSSTRSEDTAKQSSKSHGENSWLATRKRTGLSSSEQVISGSRNASAACRG